MSSVLSFPVTSAPTDSVVETEIQLLLSHVAPSRESEVRRRGLVNHIQELFSSYCDGFKLALGGSFPLQVYLPESDMDVTVLTPGEEKDELSVVMQIFSCLCQAIKENEKRNDLPFAVDDAEFKIQSIEFVNARIKVVKCVINRMHLDITANQRNSLASATFLEEADLLIGYNSLFKQGIILIKVWCLHESSKYNSSKVAICGSKEGMFSSYALSILVLYLFNLVPSQLKTPLHVLRAFLETFSTFHFDKYVLTLDGPIPIQNGGGSLGQQCDEKKLTNRFQAIAARVHSALYPKSASSCGPSGVGMTDSRFRLRTCNILDPVDPVNNLGVSVTWKNFQIIKTSMTKGLLHLNDSLMYIESSLQIKGTQSPATVPVSVTESSVRGPSSTGQLLSSTPPPPPSSQCKTVVHMNALGGAVNGIAPGLNFPGGTGSSTGSSHDLEITSPTTSLSPNHGILPSKGNPPPLVIAPSITGIAAAGGALNRGNGSGHIVASPVLPTNAAALAKEHRFLKRFFPNCRSSYQLESSSSSANHSGQNDTSGMSSSSSVSYISNLARSTSPFRDVSPVLSVNRVDRSQSVSVGAQLKIGQQPSRTISDSSSGQGASFLGVASIPKRMRSKSYTSFQHTNDIPTNGHCTADDDDEEIHLHGDLESMWRSLKHEVVGPKQNGQEHNNRTDPLRSNCYETDSSDTLTSVDDSTPPRSPNTKDTAVTFSSLSLGLEDDEKKVSRTVTESHSTTKVISPRARSDSGKNVTLPDETSITHPVMPPLIKKAPQLAIPKQQNAYSLLESPISRKVASESNIEALASSARRSNNHIIPSIPTASNNSNKSKRKKGKGKDKELIDSTEASGVSVKNGKLQNRGQTQTSQSAAGGVDQRIAENNDGDNSARGEVNDGQHNKFAPYIFWAFVVAAVAVLVVYMSGWFHSGPQRSEMRSAYMKAHQHVHRDQSGVGNSKIESNVRMMGSGFGKKAQPSPLTTNPLEDGVALLRDSMNEEKENDGDDDDDEREKNMSTLYDITNMDTNDTATGIYGDEGRTGPSAFGGVDDVGDVAEMWLVKGQNITLGLTKKTQESYARYMSGLGRRISANDDVTTPINHEGMWFKDATPLIHSNSSMYLKVTNMNMNTTGTYTFAIVKQKIRKGFSARPSGKVVAMEPSGKISAPSSASAVASVNGDAIHREGVSIIDARLDPSYEIIRVLSRNILRLGAAPSSPTKEMHLVLTTGSQLYLHIQDEGYPKPSIQWFKNGMPLKKERKNVLVVNNVEKKDEGTYTCSLTNMAGTYMWLEATVIIRGR